MDIHISEKTVANMDNDNNHSENIYENGKSTENEIVNSFSFLKFSTENGLINEITEHIQEDNVEIVLNLPQIEQNQAEEDQTKHNQAEQDQLKKNQLDECEHSTKDNLKETDKVNDDIVFTNLNNLSIQKFVVSKLNLETSKPKDEKRSKFSSQLMYVEKKSDGSEISHFNESDEMSPFRG
jgi:hypothetical protein